MPPGIGGPPGGPRAPRFLTDEEKKCRPKITKAFIKRIFGCLSPYKLQLVLIIVLNLVYALVGLLPPLITASIVDDALGGSDLKKLYFLIIADVSAILVTTILQILQRYLNTWLSQKVILDMKNEMYEHLTHMSQAFYTTEPQGDILTRMTSDIDGVRDVLTETFTGLINNIFVIILTAIALFALNWKLAIVGIVLVPLMQIPTRLAAKKRWVLLRKVQEERDDQNQQISETLSVSGSMLVKLYNREEREIGQFKTVSESVTDLTIREMTVGSALMAATQMFTQFGPVLIYLFGGIILITTGSVSLGTIIAVVALIQRLYSPISSLFNLEVTFTRSFALFERIFDYLDKDTDVANCDSPIKKDMINGDIKLENVYFEYRKGHPVLKNVSFTIPEGRTYALVGLSGAGKTTITNLIPRLYDTAAGTVSINGINVKDYDLSDLRRSIGIVTQDTYLFNGTVKENLLYANENTGEEEMINACKAAGIHEFIDSQPEKYDTLVGNRGLRLSGGEKQRVSIARVLLKDPKIIILDEATSSLDSIVEDSIQDAIVPLMKGRTCLVIAHRLSTIINADRIIVLKDGEVQEIGTHKELLGHDGLYKELFDTQFGRALDI